MQEDSAVITDVAVVLFCLFVVFLFLERVEGEPEGGGGGVCVGVGKEDN